MTRERFIGGTLSARRLEESLLEQPANINGQRPSRITGPEKGTKPSLLQPLHARVLPVRAQLSLFHLRRERHGPRPDAPPARDKASSSHSSIRSRCRKRSTAGRRRVRRKCRSSDSV